MVSPKLVDLPELRAQVGQVGLRIDATANHALEELRRWELAPVPVDVLPEPFAQRPELALLELVVQVGELVADPFPELARDDVPERVGREVPDVARRPVHVLQDAVCDVRHVDPEVLADPRVPDLRQVAEVAVAREELLLELEAEDDVQVVRSPVRVDPDQRRPDSIDRAVELVELHVAERREHLLELRIEVPPEGEAAPDKVLPHAALRFVDAERGAACEGRALEVEADLMLVEAVPELVHRREERVQVARLVAGRDPDVADARARGERVRGLVDPPRLAREAERLEDPALDLLLPLEREVAGEAGAVDRLPLADLGDQGHEPLLELVEDRTHLGGLHPRLELVEQVIVRLVRLTEAR